MATTDADILWLDTECRVIARTRSTQFIGSHIYATRLAKIIPGEWNGVPGPEIPPKPGHCDFQMHAGIPLPDKKTQIIHDQATAAAITVPTKVYHAAATVQGKVRLTLVPI